MRKQQTKTNLLFLILIFIFSAGAGFFVGKMIVENNNGEFLLLKLGLCILFFLFSLLIHIVIHEAGHMLMALIRGWKFLSFMVMGIVLSRRDGHLRLSRFSVPGAGGQCLMMPPAEGDTPVGIALYNAGGILANFLLSTISALVLITFYENLSSTATAFWSVMTGTGLLLILINGIPHSLSGIPNDGLNILKLRKDAFSTQTFLQGIRLIGYLMQNQLEMLNSFPYLCDNKQINPENPMHVMALTLDLSLAMSRMDFTKARNILKRVEADENKIVAIYRYEMSFEKITLSLLAPHSKEDIEQLLDKPMQQYLKQQSVFRPSALRVQYALARFHEQDEEKAEEIYRKFQKICQNYYIYGDAQIEQKLVEYIRHLQKE